MTSRMILYDAVRDGSSGWGDGLMDDAIMDDADEQYYVKSCDGGLMIT